MKTLAHCNDTIRTKLRQFMESVSKFESESPGEESDSTNLFVTKFSVWYAATLREPG